MCGQAFTPPPPSHPHLLLTVRWHNRTAGCVHCVCLFGIGLIKFNVLITSDKYARTRKRRKDRESDTLFECGSGRARERDTEREREGRETTGSCIMAKNLMESSIQSAVTGHIHQVARSIWISMAFSFSNIFRYSMQRHTHTHTQPWPPANQTRIKLK